MRRVPTSTERISAGPGSISLGKRPGRPTPGGPAKADRPDPVPQAQTAAVEREASPQIVTVYVTKSGYYLAKSSIPMALFDAAGCYGPCSACGPPRTDPGPIQTDVASASRPASSTERPTPRSETPDGHTATGIPTYMGPRGEAYHYTKSGKKVYERKCR